MVDAGTGPREAVGPVSSALPASASAARTIPSAPVPKASEAGAAGQRAPVPSAGGDPTCPQPWAVLAVGPQGSREPLTRVRRALEQHPEFRACTGDSPLRPAEICLYRAGYGVKYFKTPERNRAAILAECGDRKTCDEVAAALREVEPDSKPVVSCEKPLGISGGVARVEE